MCSYCIVCGQRVTVTAMTTTTTNDFTIELCVIPNAYRQPDIPTTIHKRLFGVCAGRFGNLLHPFDLEQSNVILHAERTNNYPQSHHLFHLLSFNFTLLYHICIRVVIIMMILSNDQLNAADRSNLLRSISKFIE